MSSFNVLNISFNHLCSSHRHWNCLSYKYFTYYTKCMLRFINNFTNIYTLLPLPSSFHSFLLIHLSLLTFIPSLHPFSPFFSLSSFLFTFHQLFFSLHSFPFPFPPFPFFLLPLSILGIPIFFSLLSFIFLK